MNYQIVTINESPALIFQNLPTQINDLLNLVMDASLTEGIKTIALPVDELAPAFFTLSSGYSGELLQKLTNYAIHTLIIGDIEHVKKQSKPFNDFVLEANKGHSINFINML
ncbi:DUF4180 domain-containing protein [Providencia vermicola]|uniref:DUF4180 domain-containing protein n=1 Tax=Providencia vermicola TaxID=333965 RepID=UPI00352520FD